MSVDPDCLISLIAEYEKAGLSKPEAISKATQLWYKGNEIDVYPQITAYSVQSTGMKDCVPKMISHLADAHPDMPPKQRVAVAFSKCRKKHGVAEPDRD